MSGPSEGRAAKVTTFMLSSGDDNAAAPLSPPRQRAIVADQYEFDRSAITRILRHEFDFGTISQATSYEELMERSFPGQPDLVIVNLDLLGGARLSRLRMLKNHFPRARLAVISHLGSWDMVRLTLSGGAHGYIPLQLRSEEFCSALEVILSGNIFAPFRTMPRAPSEAPPQAAVTLTRRQWEVMKLVAEGRSDKDIARHLGVAPSTIKTHVSAVFRLLRVHNRVRAAQAFLRAAPIGDPPGREPVRALLREVAAPILEPAG